MQVFGAATPEMVTQPQPHTREIYGTKDPVQVNHSLAADVALKLVIPAICIKTLAEALHSQNHQQGSVTTFH